MLVTFNFYDCISEGISSYSTSIKSGVEDRFPDKKKNNGMVELTLRQRPTSGLSSSAVAVDARLQLGCGGKIPIFQWIYEV